MPFFLNIAANLILNKYSLLCSNSLRASSEISTPIASNHSCNLTRASGDFSETSLVISLKSSVNLVATFSSIIISPLEDKVTNSLLPLRFSCHCLFITLDIAYLLVSITCILGTLIGVPTSSRILSKDQRTVLKLA